MVAQVLGTRNLPVDNQATEPVVQPTVLLIKGIHPDQQVLQSLLMPLVNAFLLGDVLLQIGVLTLDTPPMRLLIRKL